ncbi:hypothetical protein MFRU_083g00020 [Monilinia fructicola]|nr:hypothetical protein MFRU_083g00020 [Monilinia fructicola]
MTLPKNAKEFHQEFPEWPTRSLENRTDIPAGSYWGRGEIESFKILRVRQQRTNMLLRQLHRFTDDATQRVNQSQDIQNAIHFLGTDWRIHNAADLLTLGGKFAPFFTLLADVLQQPETPQPDRQLRNRETYQSPSPATSTSTSSSPSQPPAKRIRITNSAESYIYSQETDQSTHDRQRKSEITTNACIYTLLNCIAENTRREDDETTFRLEWTITQDTFHVAEKKPYEFSSTNDGNLVYRDRSSGQWKRRGKISYCSIEAKSTYTSDTEDSPLEGQEAAHIIGMLSQQLSNLQLFNTLNESTMIPLISARQNKVYIVIGTFTKEYFDYIVTGKDVERAFGTLYEYGPYDMQDVGDFTMICIICVALVLYQEHRVRDSLHGESP